MRSSTVRALLWGLAAAVAIAFIAPPLLALLNWWIDLWLAKTKLTACDSFPISRSPLAS